MDVILVVISLVAGIGLAVLLGALTNRQFDRKLECAAEADRLRTVKLARQGKCPYPPPEGRNPGVKVHR